MKRILALTLLISIFCSSEASEVIYNISGNHSNAENACIAPIPALFGFDCSYDASDPTGFAFLGWIGPSFSVGYYPIGSSPGVNGSPVAGDGKIAVPLMAGSTVTINDTNTPCDADDTIAATWIFGAAVRNFTFGPGTRGEESWADSDLLFQLAATTVDSATPNADGGCDYEIASGGMPTLLERADGQGFYPIEEDVIGEAGGFYTGPSPVGVATFEGAPNVGVPISVLTGASYNCIENTFGPCETGALGGSNFRGTRAIISNGLLSVSTDSSGNITSGLLFDNTESKIFNVPPDPVNSWDGGVVRFSGSAPGGPNPPKGPPHTPPGFCVEPPPEPPGYGRNK
jgi:hypothetical protein